MRNIKYLIVLILLGFLLASCEKEDNSVIDPVLHFPVILGSFITPQVFDTSNVSGIAWAEVASVEPVNIVSIKLKNPGNDSIGYFELKDNGVAPDTTAGDGKFTGLFSFSMTCRIVGQYKVEFLAINASNLTSSLNIQNFNVINSNNQKPIIDSWFVPDDIQIPSGSGNDTIRPVFLQVHAVDPDGSCDLSQDAAFFNSFRPDGIGSSGNPFTMYDDGIVDAFSRCDTVANDGKYSRRLYIFPNALVGSYTFKFNAKDNAQNLSDTLIRTINVHP